MGNLFQEQSSNDSTEDSYTSLVQVVQKELQANMKPEFLNRLDDVVVFSPLTEHELSDICDKLIAETLARVTDYDIQVGPGLKLKMLQEGASSSTFGARPLRR